MIPIDVANGAIQLGWSTVAAVALIAVFRLLAMMIAAHFRYRLAIGKMVFEPIEMSAASIESAKPIVPLVEGPKRETPCLPDS